MEFAKQLKEAILARKRNESLVIAKQAVDANARFSTLMQEGFAPAIVELGDKFAKGKVGLPDLVLGANIEREVMDYLTRNLPGGQYTPKATMVIGSVPMDIYFPLRMQIVTAYFAAYGIRVIDLGSNVTAEKFLAAAEKEHANIIALSTYVQTACYRQKAVFDYIKKMGKQDEYVMLIGGTGILSDWPAEKYGADVVEFSVLVAMEKIKNVLKEKLQIIL
jgi:methanogenic corrinoid protein MtbC1